MSYQWPSICLALAVMLSNAPALLNILQFRQGMAGAQVIQSAPVPLPSLANDLQSVRSRPMILLAGRLGFGKATVCLFLSLHHMNSRPTFIRSQDLQVMGNNEIKLYPQPLTY